MTQAKFKVPIPKNEPYNSYAPDTPEREGLKAAIKRMHKQEVDIPAIIGGQNVRTGNTLPVVLPHNHGHRLGTLHKAGKKEVDMAIEAALDARSKWSATPWEERVAVFLKAADLLTGSWRYTINAATMLGQSKTPHQAEIEAVGELADFLRFNAYYLTEVMSEQPHSPDGMWNRVEYRPLEGFLFAVTPFNFTAIGVNLPTSMAMCGNVVLWKPAIGSIFSNYYMMRLLQEAGLPDGVINFLPGEGPDVGEPVLNSRHFAGLQFTGSVATFNHLWKSVAANLEKYDSYPRIVGETGGKDFIFVHNTADVKQVTVAAIRGAFEYQGQKCSAASRMYIPESFWPDFRETFLKEVKKIKTGNVEDFSCFMGGVIDKKAFGRITEYIEFARNAETAEIIAGGNYDESTGYFVEPTVILTSDPHFKTMQEEIFGPVLTIYVYKDNDFEATLELCNKTSPYGLTGAVFAKDRYVVKQMADALKDAAGNFYINDKPTAAVVNQQPFGGARRSGTNDKAGSKQNMLRWLSPRAIKESYDPPRTWEYPYME